MFNRYSLLPSIFFCLFSYTADAASITWTAQGVNNDLNDPGNWNPNTVPGSGDNAVFNSGISGINTNPTSNSTPFSVSSINFFDNASTFQFNFNNTSLTFNGTGITGLKKNPLLTITNSNNGSFPGNLVSFVGATGTSGSADVEITNTAALTGNVSGVGIGIINSGLSSSGAYIIAANGHINVSNTGNDSANGTGNNGTAFTGSSQLKFDQSFNAGNDVAVSVSNNGTFSGTNTAQGDRVATVNGSQFLSSGAFQTGDNFTCEMQNSGNDNSLGVGLSYIGEIASAQMLLQTSGTVGDNCTFTISNSGTSAVQTSDSSNFVGYLNDQQFYAGNTFQAGDNFNLSVTNTGTDTSSGYGSHQIAVINSNSGTTGNQILFQQGCTLGNHAAIGASNSGTYSGTNTQGGSNVGGMNLQQIAFGDSNTPGSYNFVAGDDFTLSASNSGTDSCIGTGRDAVGTVSTDQITFYTPVSLGKGARIALSNTGNYSGNASSRYVNVGSAGGCQLRTASTFSAGDNFTLTASNSGTNSGSGVGGYYIGDLAVGQQVTFEDNFIVGSNASMTIVNSASNSSQTTFNNQVGSFMGYGKQLLAKNLFQTGDDFSLEITNAGYDNSTGTGGNYVGFINNNTSDHSATQLHLVNGASVGDRASIKISNSGTYQGTNSTSGNSISTLGGPQFYDVSDFQSGNNFSLTVSNSGIDKASGQNNNSIGSIGGSQVKFDGTCTFGNNASITLSNSGTNNDTTGTGNNIGVINGSQLQVNGNFSAGTNLNINANNTAGNEGDSNNFVGYVSESQIVFSQNCTFDDKSFIGAFNSGTVGDSQIVFDQGFNVTSGRATVQAVNQGTVGSCGIDVEGSNAGGNVEIVLNNSSLNIGTTLPSFTVGGLVGDSSSSVQSLPELIIHVDPSLQPEFSGVIENYSSDSSLTKTGSGTQILSGANTYTGLTKVQEGVLVVNGSLTGDTLVNSLGTIKGSGMIFGTLTNNGKIAPGQSIGTLTTGTYIENGGIYEVEVNGKGHSDLIHSLGTATINGGTVTVRSVDNTYKFRSPYTIVTADNSLTGTYSQVLSPKFVSSTLTYDANHVFLTISPALSNAAVACNQIGVASNLDNLPSLTDDQSLVINTLINLPLETLQKDLESFSGYQYTDSVWTTEISTNRFLRRLYDPLRYLVTVPGEISCEDWTGWVETGPNFSRLHGHNVGATHISGYQVTGGVQKHILRNVFLGIAGSYEYDRDKCSSVKAKRNTGYAGIYALFRPNRFYALIDFAYGYTSSRLKRTIEAGKIRYTETGKPNVSSFAFYSECGADIRTEQLLFQPFIGIQAEQNRRDKISESNKSGWGLKIEDYRWTPVNSRLGFHFTTCDPCRCMNVSIDLAWNQRLTSNKNSTKGRFKDFGDSYRICGDKLDNTSLEYALTLSRCFEEAFQIYAELEGQRWSRAKTVTLLAGLKYSW